MATRLYVTKMVIRFQVVPRDKETWYYFEGLESKTKRKFFLSFFFGFAYYNRKFSSIFRVRRKRAVKSEAET